MESNEKKETNVDPILDHGLTFHVNDFYTHLSVIERFINTKGLKQRAFTRAILAALEVGVAPEQTNFNFQTENEAMIAATIAKAIDAKIQIKMYKQYIKEKKEGNNGNSEKQS